MRNQPQSLLDSSSMTMTRMKSKEKQKRKSCSKIGLLTISQPEVVTCNNILDRSRDTRIECHFIDLCVAFFSAAFS